MENFENYYFLLSTIAHRMLGSGSDVEDIVQEAYLRYATAAVPEIGSLKAYLMTILTRLCLDQRKQVCASPTRATAWPPMVLGFSRHRRDRSPGAGSTRSDLAGLTSPPGVPDSRRACDLPPP